jgi:ankyrin repeat protein
MNQRTDINKHSLLHGTPLHTACRAGSLKIVQQLLLNKASIFAKCEVIKFVNGQRIVSNLTPQEVTKDIRIIALIARYQERLKSGSNMEEEIQNYGPTDSFLNTPY